MKDANRPAPVSPQSRPVSPHSRVGGGFSYSSLKRLQPSSSTPDPWSVNPHSRKAARARERHPALAGRRPTDTEHIPNINRGVNPHFRGGPAGFPLGHAGASWSRSIAPFGLDGIAWSRRIGARCPYGLWCASLSGFRWAGFPISGSDLYGKRTSFSLRSNRQFDIVRAGAGTKNCEARRGLSTAKRANWGMCRGANPPSGPPRVVGCASAGHSCCTGGRL